MFESIEQREKNTEKLAEVLPETDKQFIEGFKYAIEFLQDHFKPSIAELVEDDLPTIAKIEQEIAECTIDNACNEMEIELAEIKDSFIDNNDYCIDENGNVVKDE